jgi:hypothetical protein
MNFSSLIQTVQNTHTALQEAVSKVCLPEIYIVSGYFICPTRKLVRYFLLNYRS